MDFKPKPGSFTAYLEYANRSKEQPRPTASSPISLLEILARQAQTQLPLPDLQTISGMDTARYRDVLKSLEDAGYIAIEGSPLDAVIKLTDKGAGVARLARPA